MIAVAANACFVSVILDGFGRADRDLGADAGEASGGGAADAAGLACCRVRGHEDKIVTQELESGYDETEVQP